MDGNLRKPQFGAKILGKGTADLLCLCEQNVLKYRGKCCIQVVQV